MKEYKNLARAVALFSEELDLDTQQNISSLKLAINSGHIDGSRLKDEFMDALTTEGFDWTAFSKENRLFLNPSIYNDKDVEDYVKLLLWECLFPKEAYNEDQIKNLVGDAIRLLKDFKENDGWMSYQHLYKLLKQKPEYRDLEYFYMYYIYPSAYSKLEKKHPADKPIVKGSLRYKGSNVC